MTELSGARILVVEDEPVVARCLEDMLLDFGCVVIGPAASLAEGLRLAETEALDAALLDVNLAGARSYPIAALLKARGIPYVFATGYGALTEEAGDAPVIEKPYREAQVEAALRALLGLGTAQ